MEMKCEIVGEDSRFKGVVKVQVPGVYGPKKGAPLPKRIARLVRPAAVALQKVYRDIVKDGGHLYISDMYRSAVEQQRAHANYLSGRKKVYSPPPCASVHEAARAIDIDAFDTGIGHRRVRRILKRHGWTNIVKTLTGAECWHYEFRQPKWQKCKNEHGYRAMARAMKEEIGNRAGLRQAGARQRELLWLQSSLNKILGTRLKVDGVYGDKTRSAVRRFQRKYRLQVDSVAGPITKVNIKELLGEDGCGAVSKVRKTNVWRRPSLPRSERTGPARAHNNC